MSWMLIPACSPVKFEIWLIAGVILPFHSQLGAFDLEGKQLAILPVVEVLVRLYRG
jgi:hypothetical protein